MAKDMMKKSVWIGAILLIVILTSGYLLFFTNVFKYCPNSCDDFDECTEDFCSEKTNFECVHKSLDDCCGNGRCELGETYETCTDDCPNCDDSNSCTQDSYDYHLKECSHADIMPCCGNNLCEIGETYDNCASDCPNCDDSNSCTRDSYDYHLKECLHTDIIPCCGNGACENSESRTACPADCVFGSEEYVELGVSFLNNPSQFSDTGLRYFYSIENCLSDKIETLELFSVYNGVTEGAITKSWLEKWGLGSSEYAFVSIPTSTCGNRITLIPASSKNKEIGTLHDVKVYYKFKYQGKIFEFNSEEKQVVVLDREPMKGVEDFAWFTLDNSNIRRVG
ncbi:hypothetical protein JW711_03315 [Candidatus Woesearchaeota archaeon]|nr:hypothetical protein [Candidatus Woesearchaeota archaeon]